MYKERPISRCALLALLTVATFAMLAAGCSENPDNPSADTNTVDAVPTDTGADETGTNDAADSADAPDTDWGDVGTVNCGDKMCGEDEYCVVDKCCGADVGFNDAGEWRGSNSYRCEPVPSGCNPNKPCDCQAFEPCGGNGICTESRKLICPAA